MDSSSLQMQQYDAYLKAKAREFRDAQADAAWVMRWLGRGVNTVGHWLVRWGQGLQTAAAQKQHGVTQRTLLAQRNS